MNKLAHPNRRMGSGWPTRRSSGKKIKRQLIVSTHLFAHHPNEQNSVASGTFSYLPHPELSSPVAGTYNGTSLYGPTLRLARSHGGLASEEIKRRMKWLDSIREWQEEFVGNMTAREFVDTITGDLFSSRVFVFSTTGEPLNLPKGATVIDYAYQKDTQMANRMVGAKVRVLENKCTNYAVCALVIVFYTRGEPLNLPKEATVIEYHDIFCFAPNFCLDEIEEWY
jgi:hypothetical protein